MAKFDGIKYPCGLEHHLLHSGHGGDLGSNLRKGCKQSIHQIVCILMTDDHSCPFVADTYRTSVKQTLALSKQVTVTL